MIITWLGHASFRIVSKSGFVIYIDPFAGDDDMYSMNADVVLVSHEGYHHLSNEKLSLIRSDSTLLFSTQQVAWESRGSPLLPGNFVEAGDVKVKAVDAYSVRKGIGREKGKSLGFIISMDGKIVYFAGSTDFIPEMADIFCDIALLPVASSRTMSPKQAAEAVKLIRPKFAIPMYYGMHCGTIDDAELFRELVEESSETKVIVLGQGESAEF